MKSAAGITKTGNKTTRTDAATRERRIVSTIILAVCFVVLVAITVTLYQSFRATGENGLLTYFAGMAAIAVFIGMATLLASRMRPKKVKATRHDKVLQALITTIRTSPDAEARLAAVKGLSELDLEESAEHMRHEDIDAVLISVLQTDSDPRVLSAAAEGLSVVELEKHSYYHTHDKLYGTLLKHGIEA